MKRMTDQPKLALVPKAPVVAREPLPQLPIFGAKYEVVSPPEKHANSTIYRARSIGGLPVVIKEITPEHIHGRGMDGLKFVDLFGREAKVLIGIGHPNIAKYVEHGEKDGCLYLVTEEAPGKNLYEHFEDGGKFSLDVANKIMDQVFDGLDNIHAGYSRAIVHRDIKPHNIVVDGEGNVKIVDFGFSKVLSSTGTTFAVLPTNSLGFTAPEIALGEPGSPRSDLFSAGAVYLWLRTGKSATSGSMGGIKGDDGAYNFPDELANCEKQFLAKALDVNPQNRFASAKEMKAAFSALSGKMVVSKKDLTTGIEKTTNEKIYKISCLKVWRNTALGSGLFASLLTSAVAIHDGGIKSLKDLLVFVTVQAIGFAALLYARNCDKEIKQEKAKLSVSGDEMERRLSGVTQFNPANALPAHSQKINWDKLDLDQVEILASFKEGLTEDEAIAKAKEKGKVIVPNKVLDRILQDERLYEKYQSIFPARSGTHLSYEGKDGTVTQDGISKKITLPLVNGWYELDEFGIPCGKSIPPLLNPRLRHFVRIEKNSGLLVRGDVYYYGRQDVDASCQPSDRFGVAVVDQSVVAGLIE